MGEIKVNKENQDEDNIQFKSLFDSKDIVKSWEDSIKINFHKIGNEGLRVAQVGALFALKSHWIVSKETATIVMPTGTGKTETMIAIVVSGLVNKTLIIVPSNLLREQTSKKFRNFGVLKENGVISVNALEPNVYNLNKNLKNIKELEKIINESNVIVTTMHLLSSMDESVFDLLNEKINLLIIDEAHHIAANTWKDVKNKLYKIISVQFTATPFRNDGKKMDGKIIFNYPLSLAKEQGYFHKINFKPVWEYDEVKGDEAIADAAITQLIEDEKKNYKHIVLVRAKDKKTANHLFNEIYNKKYCIYNPVIIHSDLSKKNKNKCLENLYNGFSKIVVCVDMFGEGIDIPNLKIAAIHDKYKSLPITIQFVGRIARKASEIGPATVITNIANDDLNDSLNELYRQDSDWNLLLEQISFKQNSKVEELQNIISGFDESVINGIDIKQLKLKISMIAFKVSESDWNISKFKDQLNSENTSIRVNDTDKIIVIVQRVESNVEWINFKGITDINWELSVLYWNTNNNLLFINSTNKLNVMKYVNSLFNNPIRIDGERVFRCLYDIKRLMLSTVGLKTAIDGPIRYKMFAGIDVGDGISESQKATSIKSNIFGVGYNGNGKISIGCSQKGTIWSKWVESLDYWLHWCDEQSIKLLNEAIDSTDILKGALIPIVINERPNSIPYGIDWPVEFELLNEEAIYFEYMNNSYQLVDMDIKIAKFNDNGPIIFKVYNNIDIDIDYNFILIDKKIQISTTCKNQVFLKIGKSTTNIIDYFIENPPRIKFTDQSSLEGNLYVKLNSIPVISLDKFKIWNWDDVNIKVESQGKEKIATSVQFKVIQNIALNGYDIIFNDDSSGEIADVIAIVEKDNHILFEFYHCKYSSELVPGARVNDLYEVCGQAEKSIKWCQSASKIIDHMIIRELRWNKINYSRFDKGDIRKLKEFKNKLRDFKCSFKVYIVQPGVSFKSLSSDMVQIISGTSSYLMDTYGINLEIICSE